MNDDAFDPRDELASAYLDGDATLDERAVVEGSPELLAQVDRLRRVRAELAEVTPPPAAVRQAALAAALAEFDRAPVTAGGGEVVRIGAWRSWRWRILSGAAAAALVLVVGLAVLSGNERHDTFTSEKAADASRSADAPMGSAEVTPMAAGGEPTRSTIDAIFGPAEAVRVLTSPDELLAYASTELTAPPADPAPSPTAGDVAATAAPCPLDGLELVGDVVYVDTPAIVMRDPSTGAVRALDAATCAVLVEVAP